MIDPMPDIMMGTYQPTNGDRLREKLRDDKELASYLIDETDDGDFLIAHDGTIFTEWDDAVVYEVSWLNSPYKED